MPHSHVNQGVDEGKQEKKHCDGHFCIFHYKTCKHMFTTVDRLFRAKV